MCPQIDSAMVFGGDQGFLEVMRCGLGSGPPDGITVLIRRCRDLCGVIILYP